MAKIYKVSSPVWIAVYNVPNFPKIIKYLKFWLCPIDYGTQSDNGKYIICILVVLNLSSKS